MENKLLRDFLRFTGRGGRPKLKYYVIYLHREDSPITAMCAFFEVSGSVYYDFVNRQVGQSRMRNWDNC